MDYWKVLNLNKGASLENIKKAYRELAKKYHPDHNSSPQAADRFREIQTAYEYLEDHPYAETSDSFSDSYSKSYSSAKNNTSDGNSSSYRRNYHERYRRNAYSGTSYTQRSASYSSSASGNSYSAYSNYSSSRTSQSENSYQGYTGRTYSQPYTSYMAHPEEKSLGDKIAKAILIIICIILGVPLLLFGCIFMAILGI